MGIAEREFLLNAWLENMSGVPAHIQYENQRFTLPTSNELYIQVQHVPMDPMPLTLTGAHIERALMQINIFAPLGRQKRSSEALAEDLQSRFAFNTTFAGTGEVTRVRSKPHRGRGYSTGERWLIPVTINLETYPT